MRNIFPIIATAIFVFYSTNVKSQHSLAQIRGLQSEPKIYSAKKTTSKIKIDGQLDPQWDITPWSSEFVDIEGSNKPKPTYATQFKMLWDEEYLYIYAKLIEPHIWGTLLKRDAIIYHDNDFEIFLKPKLSSPIYYELEVNTLNTIMDLMMPKPYRFGGQAIMQWDTQNLQSAVHIEGTLNNPSDSDRYWAVEMAIPFKSLNAFGTRATPKLNDYWRINFSRVQWQHDIIDGKYNRKKLNNKLIPEDNWVWSPIGLVNMHYPERWGFLHFANDQSSPILPPFYEIEKTAWNIYYLQQLYRQKHQKYSTTLYDLEGYDEFLAPEIDKYTIELTSSKDNKFFYIKIKDKKSSIFFTIDSHGNYTTNYE